MHPNPSAPIATALPLSAALLLGCAAVTGAARDGALLDGFEPRSGRRDPLLDRLHAMGADDSARLGHVEPSPDSGERPRAHLRLADPDTSKRLDLVLVGGLQGIVLEDRSAQGSDLGLLVEGSAPDFGFDVDARIHVLRQSPRPFSFDGQYIEMQERGANSRADYTSFSRFRATMDWDSPVGRLVAGRDRQHWGPAYEYPLALGQWTNPYTLASWTLSLGSLHVRSLWADLALDGVGTFRSDSSSRALYGHRYEWRPAPWIALGATEILILHDHQEPLAFLPFVPLFMLKGQTDENRNNGELAFDADLRLRPGVRLYGEFLVDDMSEPTSLFNDLWKNRWAATAGLHLSRDFSRSLASGLVCEFSHVEPWVYTHYVATTVQATHQGTPLGNVNGPNSRSVSARGYLWWNEFTFGTRLESVWKGLDAGSRWSDTLSDNETTTKSFLGGGVARNVEISGDAAWARGPWSIALAGSWPLEEADLERARVPARFLARLGILW